MEYSEVLATLRPDGAGYVADIPGDWLNGRTAFGGLQVALCVRAMRAAGSIVLPLRSVQVTFVAPVAMGGVGLQAAVLRSGSSVIHARCELTGGSTVGCIAVAIFGAARRSGVSIALPRPEPHDVPEGRPGQGPPSVLRPTFVEHVDLRWRRGRPPFSGYDEPRSSILVRLRDRLCSHEDALIALSDSIPSPAMSMIRQPAPASSLNWMLEIIGDPADLDREDWCRIDTEVRAGHDGYLSQTAVLWSGNGTALAVSHQSVAMFG